MREKKVIQKTTDKPTEIQWGMCRCTVYPIGHPLIYGSGRCGYCGERVTPLNYLIRTEAEAIEIYEENYRQTPRRVKLRG